jgi:uncharacterized protein YndB with AHSA1/START domain
MIEQQATDAGSVSVTTDPASGSLTATAVVPASPDRVFDALTSDEITRWWVRPGVFDTREWSGDVRDGGSWRGGGIFRGQPYELEGSYLTVERPRSLVHTWHPVGGPPNAVSTVSYALEPAAGGTRIELTHGPFGSPEAVESNAIGWQTSLEALVALFRPD